MKTKTAESSYSPPLRRTRLETLHLARNRLGRVGGLSRLVSLTTLDLGTSLSIKDRGIGAPLG